MEDRAILDVGAFADTNGLDITSNHGLKPYGTPRTELDIAKHGGILGDKYAGRHPRRVALNTKM